MYALVTESKHLRFTVVKVLESREPQKNQKR